LTPELAQAPVSNHSLERSGRTSVLLALAGAFVPFVAVIISGLLAARQSKQEGPQASGWTRWLLLLLALDLAVGASLLFLSGHRGELLALAGQRRAVVAAELAPAPEGQGVLMTSVPTGRAAARAGLRAGDIVLSCEGAVVADVEALRRCVARHEPGTPVSLSYRRGGGTGWAVLLTEAPSGSDTSARPPPPGSPPAGWRWPKPVTMLACALLLALGAFAWRRTRNPAILGVAGGLGALSLTGSLLALGLDALEVGAPTRALLSLTMSPLGVLLIAVWVDQWMLKGTAPTVSSGEAGWGRVALEGAYAQVTLFVRMGIILAALMTALEVPLEGSVVSAALREGATGPFSRLLLFLAAAVLVPIAEEKLFRGVVLEGLLRALPSTVAVASAAAVFALFHGDAGPRAIFLMLVGLVLGWARLQSRGLKAPIVIHGLQNAVAAALIVFRGG
jgi:membrane protease YdiL (CAAX protease family)